MKVLVLFIALVVAVVTGSNPCPGNISKKDWEHMGNVSVGYWKSQEYPRNASFDAFVVANFHPNATSAPFGVNTTTDKASTIAGYLKVSRDVIDSFGVNTGPFFENNTLANILELFRGCDVNGVPYVSVRIDRHFYYNATGLTGESHYMATFKFTLYQDRYMIIHYTYQPSAFPESDVWPGVPVLPNKNHFFLICRELENRCGHGVNWAPYVTCMQWMLNHPYSTSFYSPTLVQGEGYCVASLSFFGMTYVKSNDPFVNLCPFIPACTGNFGTRREEIDSDFQAIRARIAPFAMVMYHANRH